MLDKETFLAYIPKSKHSLITDKFIDDVNSLQDPELRETFRDNLFRFSDLWSEFPQLTVKGFAEAILFCSYRLVGMSQVEAWRRTFPDRYKEKINREGGYQTTLRCSSAYAKRGIIVRIMERSLVPVHIINADLHQEAINVQADLMRTAKSENVRMKAAECLINALKPPEEAVLNVKMEYKADLLEELKETTRLLAQKQQEAIRNGTANVQVIAETPLSEGVVIDGVTGEVEQ